jgi:hypothetical protein
MGIGPHAIQLTRIIQENGLLKEGFDVLELGSQDFAPSLGEAKAAIDREFGIASSSKIQNPSDFYRAIGCDRYECIDLDGKHNARKFDLNFDVRDKYDFDTEFDLITNHGTTEHLLNQQLAFLNVHNLTSDGGVMVHALPFQGYQNHGMFNYNPSFFLDLAVANHYEIIGLFLSVDDALYEYSEGFLVERDIRSSQDVLVLAALRKQGGASFKTPYDGRYFMLKGRNGVSARKDVGSTIRFKANGSSSSPRTKVASSGVSVTPRSLAAPDRPYMFITPVWGESYTDTFINITLPSQLAEGNLGAFVKDEVEYVIATTAHDEEKIKSSSSFRKLQEIAAVSFVRHQALNNETNYQRQTRAMNLALRRITSEKSVFFLTADDFFADGLFAYARDRLVKGSRAVIVPTLRVNQAGLNAHLWSLRASTLKPRDLVRAIIQHEHPMLMSVIVNCPSRTMHELPSQTLVRLKDGYLGRWNVMHPLAVKVAPPVPDIDVTVDWNYPALVSRTANDIDIIRDSDLGFIASPTEINYSQDYPIERGATPRARTRNLIEWVNMKWPLNFHVLQASDFVRIHAGEIGPEWRDAENELDRVCGPYLAYIKERTPVLPENLRGSSLELLSPAVRFKRTIQMRRALRIGLKRGPARLKGFVKGVVRRVNAVALKTSKVR